MATVEEPRTESRPFIRPDGKDKVTGLGRYTADMTLTGMLYARFVFAPTTHARLVRVDTSKARALPGVLAVLTQADVPDVLHGPFVPDRRLFASDFKIAFQLSKIERKVGRGMLARDERARHDTSYLFGLIYPQKHLQERLYSIIPLLAKHGFGLIDELYEGVQLECPDHQLLVA